METQSLTPTTDLSCTFRVQSVRCWLREDTLKSLHNATNLTSFFWFWSKENGYLSHKQRTGSRPMEFGRSNLIVNLMT